MKVGRPIWVKYQLTSRCKFSCYTLQTLHFKKCSTKFFSMLSPSTDKTEVSKEPSAANGEVTYDGISYKIVREGLAEILNPQFEEGHQSKTQAVFYNPIQQFNRDLSVLAIRAFSDDLAVIRKEKHDKKLKTAAKKEQRGLKRKRENQAGNSIIENSAEYNEGDAKSKKVDLSLSEEIDELIMNCSGVIPGPSEVTNSGDLTAKPDVSNLHKPTAARSDEVKVPPENEGSAAVGAEENLEILEDQIEKQDTISNDRGVAPQKCRLPAQSSTFRILDALSGTGLRALRYAKEIPVKTSITANDLSHQATAAIMLNIKHNDVQNNIKAITGDARSHMHTVSSPSKRTDSILYEVIDLDPYGTAIPFLDAAVNAVVDGGLLCVTCTDAGVFASVGYFEKTFSQYGGISLKGAHAHEAGIRLILHSIATVAARYGRSIEPLLSLSIDFYARVFVRICYSPAEVKFLASKTMTVYNCDEGCGAWAIQHHANTRSKESRAGNPIQRFTLPQAPPTSQYCPHCGFKTHLAGPMWGGPLHNPHFIQRILDMLPSLNSETYGTLPRIEGMLTLAQSEPIFNSPPFPHPSSRPVPPLDPALRDTHPFFIVPSTLAKVLHCAGPSDAAFRGALIHLGYRTSRSHTKPGSIRTDAPWTVIWEVMREWARQKAPIKEGVLTPGTAGCGIMRKDRSKRALNTVKDTLIAQLTQSDNLLSTRSALETALSRLRAVGEKQDPVTISETQHPVTISEKQDPVTISEKRDSILEIVFDETLGKEPVGVGKRLVRYQMNPRADWGPMVRARGG